MSKVALDLAPNSCDFQIKLENCPDSIRTFVASLVSSRFLPSANAFVAHLAEFRFLKEYLDSVQFVNRDASEEVMERVIHWNRNADLSFKMKTSEFNTDIRPEYLSAIRTKLYKDQTAGVRYLSSRARSLLADSMGIGKSLEAIATYAVWRSLGIAERALVITISDVKPNWMKEVVKHSDFTATVLPNGTRAILAAIQEYKRNPTHFLITHYEGICQLSKSSVITDPETGNSEVIQALLQCPIDVVFADEAHLFKNMDTKRYRSLAYLLARLTPSTDQVEVEYELESGEQVKRIMTVGAARHLSISSEVDVL